MNSFHVIVSSTFKKSLAQICSSLTKKQSLKLAKSIDNLTLILKISPESFPIIQFEKHSELPFRKAVLSKDFIVVYLFQREKVYLVNIFPTSQSWQSNIFK